MKETPEVTACVIDHGLYLPLAVELSKHFKRVLYQNCAWIDGFPTLNKCIVGDGIEGVELIAAPDDHWMQKEEIDLYVFPDLYHAGEQVELESQGKAVWGSRYGDRMEIRRGQFLAALDKAGLEVPMHEAIKGLDALRTFLRDKEDHYVKISTFRGSMETFHWRDWDHDEGWLDQMAVKLGPAKDLITFYVFPAIDTDIEIGCDTYCIDGAYPSEMVIGYEHKDRGYFGSVMAKDDIPEQLAAVNSAFSEELFMHRYRNLISSEVRMKGDKFYFIDPTRRFPCPASGSQMKLYDNLGEIIWRGAHGDLIQPKMTGRYAAECVLSCKGAKDAWTVVDFPDALRPWIMAGGSCQIGNRFCWPPDDSHGEEIGWLVHIGDTPKSTIQGMLNKAAMLPDGVTAATDSLADLLKEVETGHEEGVPFTEQPLPEPSIVIENT